MASVGERIGGRARSRGSLLQADREEHGHVDRGLDGVDQGRRRDAEHRHFTGSSEDLKVANCPVGAVALENGLFLIEPLNIEAHEIVNAPFLMACWVAFVLGREGVTGQRRRRHHEQDEQKCRSPHGHG